MFEFKTNEFMSDVTMYAWDGGEGWVYTTCEAKAIRAMSYGMEVYRTNIEWQQCDVQIVRKA
jgi:hypothetical protein